MKIKLSIQLKAAFLIVVFGLSTAVGFACAMGVNFNAVPEKEAVKVHVHADGKKHHHNKSGKSQQKKEQNKKDDCCTDKVIKIQTSDKNLTQNFKHIFYTPVLTAMAGNLFDNNNFNISPVAHAKYVVRNFHPPPLSILIAIQRFQI
jgi:hypothetical protein